MNANKRYCQNRGHKRKKYTEPPSFYENQEDTIEEERQFKLRRFVKDVKKFVEEKEHSEKTERLPVGVHNATKKIKPAENAVKRGLIQNGMQTKFFSRGITGKEITARLDGTLQQIIAKGNIENECKCSHHCKYPTQHPPIPHCNPQQILKSRNLSNSTSSQDMPKLLPTVKTKCKETVTESNSFPSLDELDKELYPEITRIITNSCVESKTIQFKNKSYSRAVKEKLHQMYKEENSVNSRSWQDTPRLSSINTAEYEEKLTRSNSLESLDELDKELYPEMTRIITNSCAESKANQFKDKSYSMTVKHQLYQLHKKEEKKNSQELNCPLEMQKNSVLTTMYESYPPLMKQPSLFTRSEEVNKSEDHAFKEINFVPQRYISNKQLFEEYIGPSSSSKNLPISPVPQQIYKPSSPPIRHFKPHQLEFSRGTNYLNETFPAYSPVISSVCNFTSMIPDGGGDRFPFNKKNLFLPSSDEDSPEFHYFPRMMF